METKPTESKPKKKKAKKKKKFWTSEKILSLSAIFMSACTLLVLIYQTKLMRNQQHLSVYPYLQMRGERASSPDFQFVLLNNGIGPALIKAVRIHHQGKVYEEELHTYLERIITPKDSLNYNYSSLIPGQLIPPNSSINLIALKNGDAKDAKKLDRFIRNKEVDIEIEYASIYGERWVFSRKKRIPKRVD